MPSVNILTEVNSVLQSTKRINQALSDFLEQVDTISQSYCDDVTDEVVEGWIARLDFFLELYSYRELFLILGLLSDEKKLQKILSFSEENPKQLIEKVFINEKIFKRLKM